MGSQGHLSSGQLGADCPGGMSVHGEVLLVQASLRRPSKPRLPLRAKGEAASVVGWQGVLPQHWWKIEALLAVGFMGVPVVLLLGLGTDPSVLLRKTCCSGLASPGARTCFIGAGCTSWWSTRWPAKVGHVATCGSEVSKQRSWSSIWAGHWGNGKQEGTVTALRQLTSYRGERHSSATLGARALGQLCRGHLVWVLEAA